MYIYIYIHTYIYIYPNISIYNPYRSIFPASLPEAVAMEDVLFFDTWKPPAYLVATAKPVPCLAVVPSETQGIFIMILGIPWISMDIISLIMIWIWILWISVDIYGYLWISIKTKDTIDTMAGPWSRKKGVKRSGDTHYPLANVYITMERSTMLLMGKLTNVRLGHGFNSELIVITRGYPQSSSIYKWI